MIQVSNVSWIVLDIEGTMGSIDFVHKILFPYSRTELKNFLQFNKDSLQTEFKEIESQVNKKLSLEEIYTILQQWINQDFKCTPLKSIQGKIWEQGFYSNQFKSHLFPDVIPELSKWKILGKKLAIYSSGSIKAQKLYFSFTQTGNHLKLFSKFYDTQMGNKNEINSYIRIAQDLQQPCSQILFISDSLQEITVAARAGYQVILIHRDSKSESSFKSTNSFDEIKVFG